MQLGTAVLKDEAVKEAAAELIVALSKEPAVYEAVTDLTLKIIAANEVTQVRISTVFTFDHLSEQCLSLFRRLTNYFRSLLKKFYRTRRYKLLIHDRLLDMNSTAL